MRLVRLLPPLVEEFGGQRSDDEIRACADAMLSQYDDAPVRSFAMTLAHRRTRECLQRETCDMVTGARGTARSRCAMRWSSFHSCRRSVHEYVLPRVGREARAALH